jgi:hypothetical protein
MSTILQFRSAARRQVDDRRQPQSCQIIIFPGVRIERHADIHAVVPDIPAADAFEFGCEQPVSLTN